MKTINMTYISNWFRHRAAAVLGIALVAASAASCVSAEELIPEGGGGNSDESRQVVFRINIPHDTAHQTRAIAEGGAEDNVVSDLLFLMFGNDGKLLSGTDGYRIVTSDLIAQAGDDAPIKNVYTVKIEIPLNAKRALVLANWGRLKGGSAAADYLIPSLAGKTYDQVVAYSTLFNYESTSTGNKDFTVDHPFHLMGSRPFDLSTAKTAAIPLIRSLSKVNVTVSDNLTVKGYVDDKGGQLTAVDGFKLKTIRLVNVNRRAQAFPPVSTIPGMMNPDATGKMSGSTEYREYIVPAASATSFTDQIFVSETALTGTPDDFTATDWKSAPTLLIQATTKANGVEIDGWFRVNLRIKTGLYSVGHTNLLRNHKYTVNITGIGSTGYPTAEEAYNHLPDNQYIYMESTDEELGLNDYSYNGHYYIASNGPELEYSALSHTDGVLKLYTNHPGGWKIDSIEGNTGWLTSVNIGAGKTGAAESTANLSFSLKTNQVQSGIAPRTAIVTVSAGDRLKHQILITQNSTSGVRSVGNDPGVINYIFHPGYPDHYTLTMDKDNNDDSDGIVFVAYFKPGSLVAMDGEDGAMTTDNIVAWPEEWAASRSALEAKFVGQTPGYNTFMTIPALAALYDFSAESTGNKDLFTPPYEEDYSRTFGDACSYYFGNEWKTPTWLEQAAFTGLPTNAGNGATTDHTYWTYAPVYGNQPALIELPLSPGPNGFYVWTAAGCRYTSNIGNKDLAYYMASTTYYVAEEDATSTALQGAWQHVISFSSSRATYRNPQSHGPGYAIRCMLR